MDAACCFHGIGQGLFYHCTIADQEAKFHFVYDCGTLYKKDRARLNQEIGGLLGAGRRTGKGVIHALFLSHLDLDHISGVPLLLKTYEVENVFLPYFTPESLFLLAAKLDLSRGEELLRLYADPVRYFKEGGCKNIFVLHPDQDLPREEGQRSHSSENGTFSYTGEVDRSSSGGAYVYDCYGPLSLQPHRFAWRFQLYVDQSKDQQEAIRRAVSALLPASARVRAGLSGLLLDRDLLKKAKALYKSLRYGINQSSMVLYHYPVQRGEYLCTFHPCGPFWSVGPVHMQQEPLGTLLTGDLNLTLLRDHGHPFTQFVVKQPCEAVVVQLPHHGSGNSTSVHQMAKITRPGRALLVCSYGRGNPFKHPDPYLLDKLMLQCQSQVLHIVEEESFTYRIRVYPS